jgi:hypothetical protein
MPTYMYLILKLGFVESYRGVPGDVEIIKLHIENWCINS